MSAGRAKEKEGSFATNPALREVRAAPDFSIQLSRELEPRIDALVATVQTPRPTKKWIAGAAGAGGAGIAAVLIGGGLLGELVGNLLDERDHRLDRGRLVHGGGGHR